MLSAPWVLPADCLRRFFPLSVNCLLSLNLLFSSPPHRDAQCFDLLSLGSNHSPAERADFGPRSPERTKTQICPGFKVSADLHERRQMGQKRKIGTEEKSETAKKERKKPEGSKAETERMQREVKSDNRLLHQHNHAATCAPANHKDWPPWCFRTARYCWNDPRKIRFVTSPVPPPKPMRKTKNQSSPKKMPCQRPSAKQ